MLAGNALLLMLSYGYCFTSFNLLQTTITHINTWENKKDLYVGLISSAILLGAGISSLFAGSFAAKYGRVKSMIIANLFGLVSALIMMINNVVGFIIGRLLNGFLLGIGGSITSVYLAEICPQPVREFFLSQISGFIGLGGFLSMAVSQALPKVENYESSSEFMKNY